MKSKNYFSLLIILAWLIQPVGMYAQNNWTNLISGSLPGQTTSHAVAFIGDDKVVLFGGYDGVSDGLDQTWVYDLSDNAWTLKNPVSKPPGRYNHSLAYIGSDKVLLYSGTSGEEGN